MVRIIKQREPKELTNYKKLQGCSFSGLRGDDKVAVYKALIKEQYGLCAYCMCRIFYKDDVHRNVKIEHFLPQSDKELGCAESLDYKNMLGVCDGGVAYNKGTKFPSKENISCDTYKGDKKLSLNPSNKDDFEKMKIYYGSNGRIHSRDLRFEEELNSVLNLNTRRLIDARRKLIIDIINLMNKHKKMTKSQKLEWISNLKTPKDGLLPPFYDVAVKFIERFV